MQSLFKFLFLLYVFSIPWADRYNIPIFGGLSNLIFLLTLLLAIIVVVRSNKIKKPNLLHLLIGFYLLWSIITIFWSIDPSLSIKAILINISHFLLVWIIWLFVNNDEDVNQILLFYVLGASVASIIVIFSLFFGDPLLNQRYGMQGYTVNYFGFLIALSMFFAWHLFMLEKNSIQKSYFIIHIAIAFLVVLLTGSRAVFLYSTFAIMFIFWSSLRTKIKISHIITFTIVIILLITINNFVEIPGVNRIFSEKTSAQILERDFSGRSSLWSTAINTFKENSILGLGAGAYRDPISGQRAHNTFINIVVDYGIIGLILFLMLIIFSAFKLFSLSTKDKPFWIFLFLVLILRFIPTASEYHTYTWFLFGLFSTRLKPIK